MAKKVQPYSSVLQFSKKHNICLPRPHDWRLIAEPRTGEIQGIGSCRGWSIATNGILVVLETDTLDLTIGHLDWFNPDQETAEAKSASASKPKTQKTQKILAEYL